eukprot:c18712_g1_i3.p1 GENE.c18712_g1_i3~~c18712_g1_i3.p1  ORF type:complete len:169 (+),score=37.58 c18712_g1_i3:1160-1666(+)
MSWESLDQLPYLSAVIKETLRLFSPVVGIPSRRATTDIEIGAGLSAIKVPKGRDVTIDTLHHHRRPDIWGEDAGVWRPERFTDPTATSPAPTAIVTDSDDFAFVAFGAGARFCIGKNLSAMELKAVLSIVLRDHRVELVEGSRLAFRLVIPAIFKPAENFQVALVARV